MGGVERLAGAEAFASAGALHPIAVLTRPEVAVCRREFAGIERALGGPQLRLDWPHLFFAWAHELATHPTVLDTMETLLGPDILIWGSMISQKPPRTSYHFDWHQDSAFNSFLTGVPAATAWIALTESTPHNGCLQVVTILLIVVPLSLMFSNWGNVFTVRPAARKRDAGKNEWPLAILAVAIALAGIAV